MAGEVWVVPDDLPTWEPWIRAAFERWHQLLPVAFPRDLSWRSSPQWMTADEADAEAALLSLEEEEGRVTAELGARRLELAARATAAAVAGDAGARRLLTTQGSDLVVAVAAALRRIGFIVDDERDADTSRSDLLEDLMITDPDDEGWDALAEVRGYSGGAKGNDLQRIGRFVERFILKHHRPPSARWYIVSQQVGADPGSRRPPLVGSEDIDLFAEANGLIVETAELFELLRRLDRCELEPHAVRRALRCSSGVFNAIAV
jgi:hypothetical protein